MSASQVIDPDVHDLRVEDLLDLVADQVVHRLHVEVLRQPVLDAVDQRQLGGALIGLGHQTLRLVEIEVLQGDHTARFAASHQRRIHARLRHLAGDDALLAVPPDRRSSTVLVEDERLTRFKDRPARADHWHRVVREPNPAFDGVGEAGSRPLPVQDADVNDLGIEDVSDLVPDQVVHRLHVQVLGKALLDAGDDRQLGGTLIGFGQEALRLVEEASVLERHAHAARRRS